MGQLNRFHAMESGSGAASSAVGRAETDTPVASSAAEHGVGGSSCSLLRTVYVRVVLSPLSWSSNSLTGKPCLSGSLGFDRLFWGSPALAARLRRRQR